MLLSGYFNIIKDITLWNKTEVLILATTDPRPTEINLTCYYHKPTFII